MTSTVYDPDISKTAEEIELERTIKELHERLRGTLLDSLRRRLILRHLDRIRHGSELGSLIMQEYDALSQASHHRRGDSGYHEGLRHHRH
jgi:hypothetical protein